MHQKNPILRLYWIHRGLSTEWGLSLDGWLTEHSYLYRYRHHLSRLSRLRLEDTLVSHTRVRNEIRPNGQTPINKTNTSINSPPEPNDDSFEVTYYTRIYSSFHVFEENLVALEEILRLDGSTTRVLVVEMPITDGILYFFGNGEKDYQAYVDRVSELTQLQHVSFWRTETLDLIPDDSWVDYSHLNSKGAKLFSSWLGGRLGTTDPP